MYVHRLVPYVILEIKHHIIVYWAPINFRLLQWKDIVKFNSSKGSKEVHQISQLKFHMKKQGSPIFVQLYNSEHCNLLYITTSKYINYNICNKNWNRKSLSVTWPQCFWKQFNVVFVKIEEV